MGQAQDLAALMANARPKQAPAPGRVAVSPGVGHQKMTQMSASVDLGAIMKMFGVGPEAEAKKDKLVFDLWTRNRQQRASFDPEIQRQRDVFLNSPGGQEILEDAVKRGSSFVDYDMVPYEEIPGEKQPENLVGGAMGISTGEPTLRKLTPAEAEALKAQQKLDPVVDEGAMNEAKRIALEAAGFSKESEEGRIQYAQDKSKVARMKDPKIWHGRKGKNYVETPKEENELQKATTEAMKQDTPEMRQQALEKALWAEGKLKNRLAKLEKERSERPKIVMKKQYRFRDIDPSMEEQRRAADATLPLIDKAGIIGSSDGQIRAREIPGKVKHRRDMQLKRTGRPLSISHAKQDDPIKDYRKVVDDARGELTRVRNKIDFKDTPENNYKPLMDFGGTVKTYMTRLAQHGRPDIGADHLNSFGSDLDKEILKVRGKTDDATRARQTGYLNTYTDILQTGKPSDFDYKHYTRWVKLAETAGVNGNALPVVLMQKFNVSRRVADKIIQAAKSEY